MHKNLDELTAIVQQFCEERDWDQFHTPKDLAIGIITEASELLELFRFQSEEDIQHMLKDAGKRQAIGEELADVLYFLLRFAQLYDFDLVDVFLDKMKKNAQKYPSERARGSNLKYTEQA